MSSWTPPTWLKSNDSLGNGTLAKKNGAYDYAGFAHWWKISLEKDEAMGFLPDVISIQNEPDIDAGYGSCHFDSSENSVHAGYDKALKAVYDTLAKTHPTWATRLAGPEVSGIGNTGWPLPLWYTRAMDRIGTGMFSGYVFHLYSGNGAPANNHYLYPDGFTSSYAMINNAWQDGKWRMATELTSYATPVASDLMSLARIIHGAITGPAQMNGYFAWQLTNQGSGADFINLSTGAVGPSFAALRHFARFTRAGWHRVEATSSDTGVRVVAFASPSSDTVTVVALNVGTSASTYSTGAVLPAALQLWQSVVGGAQSQKLTLASGATSIALPAQSVTTYQYLRIIEKAPSIAMSCPTTALYAPGTLSCTWQASDSNGTVKLVELLQNGIGVNYLPQASGLSSASGTYSVSDLAVGSYTFTPKVTNNQGTVTYGSSVKVAVTWNYALTTSGASDWFGGLFIGYRLPTGVSATAEVVSSTGTVLKTISLPAGSTSARFTSLSGRPAGVYSVRLLVNGATVASKSVVKL
jgi:O-glycosyl hydrolase